MFTRSNLTWIFFFFEHLSTLILHFYDSYLSNVLASESRVLIFKMNSVTRFNVLFFQDLNLHKLRAFIVFVLNCVAPNLASLYCTYRVLFQRDSINIFNGNGRIFKNFYEKVLNNSSFIYMPSNIVILFCFNF